MNMNNACASFGWLAAAFEKTVLKVGLSAWRTRKVFHAVLCEGNAAWWYVVPQTCGEAYIVKGEKRWHETQRWFCTFEAQRVNMLLRAPASIVQHRVSAKFVHPSRCIVCCRYDSSLHGCWMFVQNSGWRKLQYICRYFEELEGQTRGVRQLNSTGGTGGARCGRKKLNKWMRKRKNCFHTGVLVCCVTCVRLTTSPH